MHQLSDLLTQKQLILFHGPKAHDTSESFLSKVTVVSNFQMSYGWLTAPVGRILMVFAPLNKRTSLYNFVVLIISKIS